MAYPSLSNITITPGSPFHVNFTGDLQYLAKLDADRMLYNFRKAFGEPTDAEPIYGWDAPDGLLRGHSTGHFLSALALAYSATGDESYKTKLDYMVGELCRLQLKSKGDPREFRTVCTPEDAAQEQWSTDPNVWGEGFLSAYAPDQFALLEQFTPYARIWAPYYTLHKLLAGLIEVYERTGNTVALNTATGIGRWVCRRLSALTPEHRAKMWKMYIAGEFGGMNESMARLALLTGDKTFLDGAKMFDNENIFPGLAKGEDTIKHLHANQHIPQIMGALLEYRATGSADGGDKTYLDIAKNFFDIVTEHYLYAIGGVGQGECFRDPDTQAKFIKSDTNCETCATYNLIKIARELYSLDPTEAKYMDYIERGLFNHILASRNPEITEYRTNGVTYMLPIGPGVEKSYTDDYHSFTCCHGTGMENHVKYGDCIYFLDGDTVYVNQYIPSTMDADGIRVTVDIPVGGACGKITVRADRNVRLKLRIPVWCEGNPFEGTGVDGRYAVLECEADTDVTVCADFGSPIRFEVLPDKLESGESVAALLCGSLVMVTCDDSEEYIPLSENAHYDIFRDGGLSVKSEGRTFRPIYEVHGEHYHTYFIMK